MDVTSPNAVHQDPADLSRGTTCSGASLAQHEHVSVAPVPAESIAAPSLGFALAQARTQVTQLNRLLPRAQPQWRNDRVQQAR